jgi:hypothetical protein
VAAGIADPGATKVSEIAVIYLALIPALVIAPFII